MHSTVGSFVINPSIVRITCRNVVLSPAILKRNPHFAFTETVENVVPVAGKVYPLSPDTTAATFIPSLINKQHSGTYTSA